MPMQSEDDDLHAERGIEAPAFVVESETLAAAFSEARRAHTGHTRGGPGRPNFEDSGLTIGEVTERFGPNVGELVGALTEDPSIGDWEDRKLALRERVAEAGPECAAIYIADKLANLHDWRVVYAEVGERAVEFFKAPTLDARIRAWHADLEMGERIAARLRLTARLRRELERFERERLGEPPGIAGDGPSSAS